MNKKMSMISPNPYLYFLCVLFLSTFSRRGMKLLTITLTDYSDLATVKVRSERLLSVDWWDMKIKLPRQFVRIFLFIDLQLQP